MEASPERSCVVCRAELGDADPRRIYCSDRCRQKAHRRRSRSPKLRLVDDVADPVVPGTEGTTAVLQDEEEDVNAKFERALVGAVMKAATHDWRAAQWLLANRYPRKWRR